ncbi:hypothetical protein IW261DRAFT_731485 [Armillaria novae-zelandiae]|uniref:Secreted protein n=1 Tax=Armillaria novae-zelandiae TaxID=153914 RepID=A0AA39U810_9AGAR|nr:hypothetical protein IW261DRAFT_731485 [Armillaria novae-zelandiae]
MEMLALILLIIASPPPGSCYLIWQTHVPLGCPVSPVQSCTSNNVNGQKTHAMTHHTTDISDTRGHQTAIIATTYSFLERPRLRSKVVHQRLTNEWFRRT